MILRHISTALSLAIAAASFTVSAASVSDYPEISRYVGPSRTPSAPAALHYMPDGTSYVALSADGGKLIRRDIRTDKDIETLLDLSHTRETTLNSFEDFTLSPDGSKIMLMRKSRPIYRHSFSAEYYIYEIRTRLLRPLSVSHPRQQSPVFSPDGRMVSFMADNNIYIKKIDYNSEVAVTTDGAQGSIINGVPDWTYEEEFATTCSMVWSPDNLTLAYLKYNETDVPAFTFQLYEGYCEPMPQYALYPGDYTYKYPVAGQQNSKVSLHVYDVETRATKQIALPDLKIEYIPRLAFGGASDRLMVTTLNREQNRMELYSVNPRSTVVKSVLVEQSSAWLTPVTYEGITYSDNFFVVNSSRSGWNHLYVYSYTGALQRQLTSGEYDVDRYYGFDPQSGCHYFRSTASGAINRTVSRIDAKGKITPISPAEGTADIVSASPGMSALVMSYSNVTTAPVYTLASSAGKTIRTLEDNAGYQARYASAPKPEFFTMTSDGYTLNGYIIKPAGFDPSRKYPVIMSQYSGPDSQEVLNRWSVGAETFFATQGFVVVCVDDRGTGGRGRAFSDVVYKRLGYYESIDQVAAACYAAQLPYVDPSKIAIYGWSYGGYEAIMASQTQGAPYAAAVAVAPVTDWRFYDTVYAERYMQTPQANEEGYDTASTLNKIENRNCPLLIMTGTADDNVHLFNTIRYASSAQEKGRWCDMLLFPNKNHSIVGCNSREVVYARLLDYVKTHIK